MKEAFGEGEERGGEKWRKAMRMQDAFLPLSKKWRRGHT